MKKASVTKKILIVTCQALPDPKQPATGGSLRAQSIGEALQAKGHTVVYSVPQVSIDTLSEQAATFTQWSHQGTDIHRVISQVKPDVVLFGNWGLLLHTESCNVPVIVDINGSLILENYFRNRGWPIIDDAQSKIQALAKADLIVAGSKRQKAYLFAWCLLAGIDPERINIEVVPFSLNPERPEAPAPNEAEFIIAGYNWPWLNGQAAIEAVCKELEALQRGRLNIYTQSPPYVDTIPGEDSDNDSTGNIQIEHLARVQIHNAISFEELVLKMSTSSVALDVWVNNPERELSYPSRTVAYLWCGLPVIVSAHSEIAEMVDRYRAGWVVDSGDRESLCRLIRDIVTKRLDLAEYRRNARKMACEQLTWDRTIAPVHFFCCKPFMNRSPFPVFASRIAKQKELEENYKTSEKKRTDLEREIRFLKISYRNRTGVARFISFRLFGIKLDRFFIGVPVLAYLFLLVSLGRLLQDIWMRWRQQ